MTTLSRVAVENFLSLHRLDLDLSPLNVLVGPNGGGKTNLLKAFQFLGDVARLDLVPAIHEFGGFDNLLFRGEESKEKTIRINFTGIITQYASINAPDEYKLSFWQRQYSSSQPEIPSRRVVQRTEEIILKRTAGRGRRITLSGRSATVERTGVPVRREVAKPLSVQAAATGLATLRRLGEDYEASQVESLAKVFEELRLFEINVDRIRRPSAMRDAHRLRADAANLAAFLLWLRDKHMDAFGRVCDDVRFVLPGFEEFRFISVGGSDEAVRIDIKERNLIGTTPLGRVSFGTIRSIALFAMLHDPEPPKLTCLEEIDHGLHPHALDRLVDRLREASERTQMILATHSPALVNRLSIDELVVVERDQQTGASNVFKPSPEKVGVLQEKTRYGLGELWFSGALGGGL